MADESADAERQGPVLDALRARSLKLAGMYRTALRALQNGAEDGCETARISVICHCVREIMIGLPAVMAETSIPRPKPSSNSLVETLPELIAKHPDLDLAADQDVVPLPRAVAAQLDQLVKTSVQEAGRNRSNAAALVTGLPDADHPAIKQWLDAYRFFVGWAHLDRNHERNRELPTDQTLRTQMRVVEDVIEVRTAAFFENVHAVEDMLAEINKVVEESP